MDLLRCSGIAFFLLLTALPAQAYKWTEAELRAAPQYCAVRFSQGKDHAAWQSWAKRFGPAAIHMRHYCDGLLWLNRYAKTLDKREQIRILQSAHSSFMYMVPRVDATWPLRAELYYNLGHVQALRGLNPDALKAFRQAIEFDPKFSRAYIGAAHLLEKLGERQQALALVSDGLRHLPEDAQLRAWYQKLGGRLPYPEPIAAATVTPATQDTAPAVAMSQRDPHPAAAAPDAPVQSTAGESPAAAAADELKPRPESPSGNLWCRFCPVKP